MNITDLDWWLEDTVNRVPDERRKEWQLALNGTRYFRPDNKDIDDVGNPVPYGTGPHSFYSFKTWVRLLGVPAHILEIGFNCGAGSSSIFASAPKTTRITSIDIRDSKEVRFASSKLNEKFNDRHKLVIGDSAYAYTLAPGKYDGAFIDGDHSEAGILRDIEACRRLGIRQFLFDDIFPQFGETLPAIRKSGLRLLAIVGANMAICEEE